MAVENSVTLLIGVRMGGGRMAGQDRSMLGGMKALILVNPSITSKQPSLLPLVVFVMKHFPEMFSVMFTLSGGRLWDASSTPNAVPTETVG